MLDWMRVVGLIVAYIILVATQFYVVHQADDQRHDIIVNQATLCHNQMILLQAIAEHDISVEHDLRRAAKCEHVIP